MLDPILGSALGGVFRLAPEAIKLVDSRNERKHQQIMLDKQIEIDKQKSADHLADTRMTLDSQEKNAEIAALVEAVKDQGKLTGFKFADSINSLVRPMLAIQWLILLWPAVIIAGFLLAVQSGTAPLDAMHAAFGVDEKALACSVASFFLLDRTIRKAAMR